MKIIAHRCGTDKYPELTIASAKHSLKNGAAYVEMDTRFTSDDVIVINHDDNGNFLFGVDKKVKDMTAAEFLSLRHKTDVSFPAYSLEHFLQAGIKSILFHVKVGGKRLPELLSLCEKYGIMEDAAFGLHSVEEVKYLRERYPSVKILSFMPDVARIEEYAAAGTDYIRLWEHWLTEENVQRVLATGKKLWIMSGNYETVGYTDLANLAKWRDMGADGVLLNDVCNLPL